MLWMVLSKKHVTNVYLRLLGELSSCLPRLPWCSWRGRDLLLWTKYLCLCALCHSMEICPWWLVGWEWESEWVCVWEREIEIYLKVNKRGRECKWRLIFSKLFDWVSWWERIERKKEKRLVVANKLVLWLGR